MALGGGGGGSGGAAFELPTLSGLPLKLSLTVSEDGCRRLLAS